MAEQAQRLFDFALSVLGQNEVVRIAFEAIEDELPGTLNDAAGDLAAAFSKVIGAAVQHPEWAAAWDTYARTIIKRRGGTDDALDAQIAALVERTWIQVSVEPSGAMAS